MQGDKPSRTTTTIRTPSEADLWDRYARVLAGPKLVLRLKSLVFLPTSKTAFVDCLARSGLRAPDGRAWSPRSVNVVLEELLGEGLLTEDLACPPALLHPVAIDAMASADDARRGIAAAGDPTGVTRQALEGTAEFLGGRNEAALHHYRDALKLHRKQAGKRKVFLNGVHGLFFLMALLRANDAPLQAEAQAGIDAALSAPSAYAGGFLAMQALLWLAQGLEPKARALLGKLRAALPAELLSAACVALAEHAVDPDLTHRHDADLDARFERLKDTLPLVTRIYAEILASVSASPGLYKVYLAEADPGVEAAFTPLI